MGKLGGSPKSKVPKKIENTEVIQTNRHYNNDATKAGSQLTEKQLKRFGSKQVMELLEMDSIVSDVKLTSVVKHSSSEKTSETEVVINISFLDRFMARTEATISHKIDHAKTQIGCTVKDVVAFYKKNNVLFKGFLALKINQLTGKFGEYRVISHLSGNKPFYIYNKGKKQLDTVVFDMVPGSYISLQRLDNGNGLEGFYQKRLSDGRLIYVIIEAKTTALHADDARKALRESGQFIGSLSERQKEGITYAIDQVKEVLLNTDLYGLTKSQTKELRRLNKALEKQYMDPNSENVVGIVHGQVLDEQYNVVVSSACPAGLMQVATWFGGSEQIKKIFGVDMSLHPSMKIKGNR